MPQATPLKQELPLFPLNVVVFPHETVELYVFEPRYCELVRQCEENEHGFGIVPVLRDRLLMCGTEVELLRVKRSNKRGTARITVRGKRVFNVLNFEEQLPGHLYGGGMVAFRSEESLQLAGDAEANLLVKSHHAMPKLNRKVKLMFNEIRELLTSKGGFILATEQANDAAPTAYAMARQLIGLELKEKAILLTMEKETERLAFICEHMHQLLATLKSVLES